MVALVRRIFHRDQDEFSCLPNEADALPRGAREQAARIAPSILYKMSYSNPILHHGKPLQSLLDTHGTKLDSEIIDVRSKRFQTSTTKEHTLRQQKHRRIFSDIK